MLTTNQYGLERTIPEPVKRAVRQRDGFGCVICGKAIIEYEHFSPPFDEAHEHTVDGIVLLCSEHHSLKTRGWLSIAAVEEARAAPAAKAEGFSHGALDVGIENVALILGTMKFRNIKSVIRIYGEDVLSLSPAEEAGGPVRINARLRNLEGEAILDIVNNEWRSRADNWDVEAVGNRISIRNAPRDIALILRSEPRQSLVVERIRFQHRGLVLDANEGGQTIATTPNGATFASSGSDIDGADAGIIFDERGLRFGEVSGRAVVNGHFFMSTGGRDR